MQQRARFAGVKIDHDSISLRRASVLFRLAVGIYFMGGFISALVSLLVPRLRLVLGLDYTQASLVQLAFHSSYLLFAWPVTQLLVRIGYMRGIATGLTVMAASCIGVIAAMQLASFLAVLLALLALAGGITFLQIAGNVVVAVVESERRATWRMTLLQGFNSIGTVLGPLVGAQCFLARTTATMETLRASLPFAGCAVVLSGLATAFFGRRTLLAGLAAPRPVRLDAGEWRSDHKLWCGVAAMFAYVGAEVTIGSMLANFLALPRVLGATPLTAGRLVSLYWAGAMVGRFAGAALLVRLAAPRLLAIASLGAVLLTGIAVLAGGRCGAVALVAVGLCNAIMYPTIFALSLPDDEGVAPQASMLLCMAVVGGAVVPVLTGMLADATSLQHAFVLSLACYLGIAGFARLCLARARARA